MVLLPGCQCCVPLFPCNQTVFCNALKARIGGENPFQTAPQNTIPQGNRLFYSYDPPSCLPGFTAPPGFCTRWSLTANIGTYEYCQLIRQVTENYVGSSTDKTFARWSVGFTFRALPGGVGVREIFFNAAVLGNGSSYGVETLLLSKSELWHYGSSAELFYEAPVTFTPEGGTCQANAIITPTTLTSSPIYYDSSFGYTAAQANGLTLEKPILSLGDPFP